MPLPGGSAAKFGIKFEALWTALCLLKVLNEEYESIRLEPPGPEGQGVEFWIKKNGVTEYHQVKSQNSVGDWSLNSLNKEGVLIAFAEKLADPDAHCVFVSRNSASQFRELTDRARNSASWPEFESEFLNSQDSQKNFATFQKSQEEHSGESSYEKLKRIHIETIDDHLLLRWITDFAFMLIEGNSEVAIDVLQNMTLDKIHQVLTPDDIWDHLDSRELSPRRLDKDQNVLSAVRNANEKYLNSLRRQSINGSILPRQEVQTVCDFLTGHNGKPGVMVTGEAGIGKSGVMLQVVESLLANEMPVVAFRADQLRPVQKSEEVGEQFDLPDSPAKVLAALSKGKTGVLVIDQLDAWSFASGRSSAFLDCIHEIVQEAQVHSNLRVLLACRRFDLENDPRMRQLTGSNATIDTVTIERLSPATVKEVVTNLSLDAEMLSKRQLNLLSIPLHLKMLSELVAVERVRDLQFDTAQDLYGEFWDFKYRMSRQRLGRSPQWVEVLHTLCNQMHERQSLFVPESVVDTWPDDVAAMVSENVLVRENKQVSFFHEGFFDYVFARRFASLPESLSNLLQSDEQHLFRRAQVRQVLMYLRDADPVRYLQNLEELLHRPTIRFHIKQVVLALLSDIPTPREEEWHVVSDMMAPDFTNPLTRLVWMLPRHPAWFSLVDSTGLVQQWLNDPSDTFVDEIVSILRVVQRQLPDKVAELAEPFIGKSEVWNRRLFHLAIWGNWSAGRRFLELVIKLIDEGILDDLSGVLATNSDFWNFLHRMHPDRPEWGCEVISHYLYRMRKLSLKRGERNPFDYSRGTIPLSPFADVVLNEIATDSPESFAREILPFMQSVLADCATHENEGLVSDPIWAYVSIDSVDDVSDGLLNAMVTALSELAKHQPETFRSIIEPVRHSPYKSLQFLVVRSLAANGQEFADEAVDHLLDAPERLQIGYVSNQHWATKQLIEAVSPHCSHEKLQSLETLLLQYYPSFERGSLGRKFFGHAQFTLLNGITPDRLSPDSLNRLKELRRKFKRQEPSGPTFSEAQFAQSPIPEDSASLMNDEQWLSAIKKYDVDDHKFNDDGTFLGGAHELSKALEDCARLEPLRFAKLAMRFPDNTHHFYFEAILRGISNSSLDVETIANVLKRCDQIEEKPLGKAICNTIESFAHEDLPNDILDLIVWYAVNDPDPQQELWKMQVSQDSNFYYGGDPLQHGINTTRGTAAYAIATLIDKDQDRFPYLKPTLVQLVQDNSVAVRSCVARPLLATLNYHQEWSIHHFLQLCSTDDALLQTPFVEKFLHFACHDHFPQLSHILKRMNSSQSPRVASAGSRQTCLAALLTPDARDMAEACLNGSENQKIGAAKVMAANFHTAEFRQFCEKELVSLFNDTNAQVRDEAARCFSKLKGNQIQEHTNLVNQFVSSTAFQHASFSLLTSLNESTARLPEITLTACEKFVDKYSANENLGNQDKYLSTDVVVTLVLRTYQQHSKATIQTKCLDLIDELLKNDDYELTNALKDFER